MGYTVPSSSLFVFSSRISQSFPFPEDVSICFWFVCLNPGLVISKGSLHVHMGDLSSILLYTFHFSHRRSYTLGLAILRPQSLLSPLPSCLSCLPPCIPLVAIGPSTGLVFHLFSALHYSSFSDNTRLVLLLCWCYHQLCCPISSFTPSLENKSQPCTGPVSVLALLTESPTFC